MENHSSNFVNRIPMGTEQLNCSCPESRNVYTTYLTVGSAAVGVAAVRSAVDVLILDALDPDSLAVIFFFRLFRL